MISKFLYPRTIEIRRSRTVAGTADAIGDVGYSGLEAGTEGEDVIQTGVPASIQAGATGRKRDSTLPADAFDSPTWRIFIPKQAVAKGVVRDRDVIVDDESYRYQVGQAYWDSLGYQLSCIRSEG